MCRDASLPATVPFVSAADVPALFSASEAIVEMEAALAALDGPRPRRYHEPLGSDELLLMPATAAAGVGVKVLTIAHDNPKAGLPLIQGLYVLFAPDTLAPELMIDGAALTAVRTAAVSALATKWLAREDAHHMTVYGAGVQGVAHVRALCSVRPIETVEISGRDDARVAAAVAELSAALPEIRVVAASPDAVRRSQIVCTCTTSSTPIVRGADVRAGTHINAIGSYTPTRRELDGEAMAKAKIIVETRETAMSDAGDILLAIEGGSIPEDGIAGELHEVVQGKVRRTSDDEVTVFKSVGIALADLIAARVIARALAGPGAGEPGCDARLDVAL